MQFYLAQNCSFTFGIGREILAAVSALSIPITYPPAARKSCSRIRGHLRPYFDVNYWGPLPGCRVLGYRPLEQISNAGINPAKGTPFLPSHVQLNLGFFGLHPEWSNFTAGWMNNQYNKPIHGPTRPQSSSDGREI
ncbi:uncharacterized protein LACBIDRAFT_322655 [Laccaria bicolor S238N-H82]|uniref:Predicted protein n=1 Tax=Laccaria bicolor (strain S238N-H82 / ATCC MYA-4686) TaxID=486041 RepID=B0CX28_LACBS|nr:uncharacterized protein LACBIDRAFT_322655 [Laccaria bicolor S238N-H82]EDR13178.1 predicted protein [Laccaria bicolor S238N-H82]|eukprot:XP_001875676.1 predicted protein [Laccaria bicolor S238N-H82]